MRLAAFLEDEVEIFVCGGWSCDGATVGACGVAKDTCGG